MVEAASHFRDKEREALGCIVSLTVEFHHIVRRIDLDSPDAKEFLQYVGDSTFCGVDSFMILYSAFRLRGRYTHSRLPQRVISIAALREEFVAMYRVFADEKDFEKRCRLLVDLFKLQIVFAGLTYD